MDKQTHFGLVHEFTGRSRFNQTGTDIILLKAGAHETLNISGLTPIENIITVTGATDSNYINYLNFFKTASVGLTNWSQISSIQINNSGTNEFSSLTKYPYSNINPSGSSEVRIFRNVDNLYSKFWNAPTDYVGVLLGSSYQKSYDTINMSVGTSSTYATSVQTFSGSNLIENTAFDESVVFSSKFSTGTVLGITGNIQAVAYNVGNDTYYAFTDEDRIYSSTNPGVSWTENTMTDFGFTNHRIYYSSQMDEILLGYTTSSGAATFGWWNGTTIPILSPVGIGDEITGCANTTSFTFFVTSGSSPGTPGLFTLTTTSTATRRLSLDFCAADSTNGLGFALLSNGSGFYSSSTVSGWAFTAITGLTLTSDYVGLKMVTDDRFVICNNDKIFVWDTVNLKTYDMSFSTDKFIDIQILKKSDESKGEERESCELIFWTNTNRVFSASILEDSPVFFIKEPIEQSTQASVGTSTITTTTRGDYGFLANADGKQMLLFEGFSDTYNNPLSIDKTVQKVTTYQKSINFNLDTGMVSKNVYLPNREIVMRTANFSDFNTFWNSPSTVFSVTSSTVTDRDGIVIPVTQTKIVETSTSPEYYTFVLDTTSPILKFEPQIDAESFLNCSADDIPMTQKEYNLDQDTSVTDYLFVNPGSLCNGYEVLDNAIYSFNAYIDCSGLSQFRFFSQRDGQVTLLGDNFSGQTTGILSNTYFSSGDFVGVYISSPVSGNTINLATCVFTVFSSFERDNTYLNLKTLDNAESSNIILNAENAFIEELVVSNEFSVLNNSSLVPLVSVDQTTGVAIVADTSITDADNLILQNITTMTQSNITGTLNNVDQVMSNSSLLVTPGDSLNGFMNTSRFWDFKVTNAPAGAQSVGSYSNRFFNVHQYWGYDGGTIGTPIVTMVPGVFSTVAGANTTYWTFDNVGVYKVLARAPGAQCGASKCRIRNQTLGATIQDGSNGSSNSGNSSDSWVGYNVTVSNVTHRYSLQQRVIFSGGTTSGGIQANFAGAAEVYSQVWITRLI